MINFELRRWYLPECTLGELFINDRRRAFTLERPWLNNRRGESCIPEGEYTLEFTDSPKFGRVLYLSSPELGVGLNEGLRTHILIHPANIASELQGCIALGNTFGSLRGELAVLNSRKTCERIFKLTEQEHVNKIVITKN